jgi:hypothetical protein
MDGLAARPEALGYLRSKAKTRSRFPAGMTAEKARTDKKQEQKEEQEHSQVRR